MANQNDTSSSVAATNNRISSFLFSRELVRQQNGVDDPDHDDPDPDPDDPDSDLDPDDPDSDPDSDPRHPERWFG